MIDTLPAPSAAEEHRYPCPTCGGIGFTGQHLTQPCRACGTTGEVVDRPRPRQDSTPWPSVITDPWFTPGPQDAPLPF